MRSLLSLLVVAALSGCVTTSESLTPASAPLPDLHALTFGGCREQAALLPVPAAEMQGFLPEGFSLVTLDPAGQVGLLFALTFTCASLAGAADGQDVSEMTGLLVVEPPEALRLAEEGVTYGVPVGSFASSEEHAAVMTAWGYPSVSVGEIRLDLVEHEGTFRLGHATGTDGATTADLYTTVQGPASTIGAGLARLFLVADGEVTGAVDVRWNEHQAVEDGQALFSLQGGGMPIPPTPGLAMHYWADDYGYQVLHTPAAALLAEGGSSTPAGLPHGLTLDVLGGLLLA